MAVSTVCKIKHKVLGRDATKHDEAKPSALLSIEAVHRVHYFTLQELGYALTVLKDLLINALKKHSV